MRDALWQHVDNLLPRPQPSLPYPSLQTGEKVYMTVQAYSDLTPKWQGPYTVILLTLTTTKLKEITPWVHITWLKKVNQPNDKNGCQTNTYQVSHTGPTTLSSHGFHQPQLAMDEPVSFTASIIPGTTSGRYLGLESSRIHAWTHWRLHLHPVATGNVL